MTKRRAIGWASLALGTVAFVAVIAHGPTEPKIETINPEWQCATTTYAGQPCEGPGPTTTVVGSTSTAKPTTTGPTTTVASTTTTEPWKDCAGWNPPLAVHVSKPCPPPPAPKPTTSGPSTTACHPTSSDIVAGDQYCNGPHYTVPTDAATTTTALTTTTTDNTPADVERTGPPKTPALQLPATR